MVVDGYIILQKRDTYLYKVKRFHHAMIHFTVADKVAPLDIELCTLAMVLK